MHLLSSLVILGGDMQKKDITETIDIASVFHK